MDCNYLNIQEIRIPANNNEEELISEADDKFLCLLNRNGVLGAAYYSFSERTLNIYEEIVDISPQYLMTFMIYREIVPKYLLTFGGPTEDYVKILIDLFEDYEDSIPSSNVSRIPKNFFLVSLSEFPYEACKTIISNIELASNIQENFEHKQDIYLNSFVNFDSRLSVQALSALYKCLERNWSLFGINSDEKHFLHIHQVTLKNRVLIDSQSFKSLQIFSQKSHDSGFKRGKESSSREGISVFKLFTAGCKSQMGQSYLRDLMQSPINDSVELNKRLNFLSFIQHSSHFDLVGNIQDNIRLFRGIGHVGMILGRIQNAKASNRDWYILHKMIYHTIYINDITKSYREQNEILQELNLTITEYLLRLEESIANALDFSAGNKKGRPVIKFGLDPNLDAKLLHQKDVAKHITAAARFALNDLPDYINECKVVYLPEMGHVMAIKEWEPNCQPEELQYLGYQYMFSLGGIIHYKNPLCVELDTRLGDINSEIIDHENRILRRLSAFTLKYNKDIRLAIRMVAKIDCLIGIAKLSQQNNYVKPEINEMNVQEIVECRHSLVEQLVTNFKSNNYYSGRPHHSHVNIITGVNGSGKSIYLKQVALIIFLTHVGCFVPARKANISLVKNIHCSFHSPESAVVRLSSFMMDITQASNALHYAGPKSLIVIDEFGQGTLGEDSLVLTAAFLKYFLEKKELCPHILLSTHMQRIADLLPSSPYLEFYKMDHTFQDGNLCFLYQLSKGISDSFAFDLIQRIYGDEQTDLAQYYFQILKGQRQSELSKKTVEIQEKLLANLHFVPDNNEENQEN